MVFRHGIRVLLKQKNYFKLAARRIWGDHPMLWAIGCNDVTRFDTKASCGPIKLRQK